MKAFKQDKETETPRGWNPARGLWLTGLMVLAVGLIPTIAFAGGEAEPDRVAAHDHAAHSSGLEDELAKVRRATARFHRVEEAIAAGYELGWVNGSGNRIITGCVSHPTAGAMGYHYFHPQLMADLAVDASEPEALVYAPSAEGELRLVAVEWIARGANTNPPGVSEPPSVLGMHMHILVSRGGLLHHARLAMAHEPGRNVRRLEPANQLPVVGRA